MLKEITFFLKNDAQMDPNWVPKPNKINKNSNEICGKVQRIVSNTNAYNRISVVWGGGDDTPHGVFDLYRRNPKYDARAHPRHPSAKPLHVIMINIPST